MWKPSGTDEPQPSAAQAHSATCTSSITSASATGEPTRTSQLNCGRVLITATERKRYRLRVPGRCVRASRTTPIGEQSGSRRSASRPGQKPHSAAQMA